MDKKNELRLAHYLLLWSSLFYVFSQTFLSIKEGVNGVNLLATKGEKYILTTDMSRIAIIDQKCNKAHKSNKN